MGGLDLFIYLFSWLNLRLFLVTQAGPGLKTLLLNLQSPRNTDTCPAFLKNQSYSHYSVSVNTLFVIEIVTTETEHNVY